MFSNYISWLQNLNLLGKAKNRHTVFVSFPRFHRIIIQMLLAPKPFKQLQAKIVATDSFKNILSHFQWSTVPRLLLLQNPKLSNKYQN